MRETLTLVTAKLKHGIKVLRLVDGMTESLSSVETKIIKPALLLFAAVAGFVLTGCSAVATYQKAPSTGRFSGELRMVAIAPDTFFFFQPDNAQAFTFTTHKRGDAALANSGGRGQYRRANWTIRPEEMITNGASVPRNLWYVPGFSAFDYTRAALIHDWLYEAHHRYEIAKAGYEAARQRRDQAAEARNRAEMDHYREYGDIGQEDAADIFAECIKVAMIQSKDIADEFGRSPRRHELLDTESGQVLKQAFRYNRPSPRTLWAYHYFVSPDCFVKQSKRMWQNNQSDLEIYRVLTSPRVAQDAQNKGYLSPWLIGKFREILAEEKQKDENLRRAKEQGVVTDTEVRPSLPEAVLGLPIVVWDTVTGVFQQSGPGPAPAPVQSTAPTPAPTVAPEER
jgi:Protein of unknown function (DUF1353)